VIAGIPAGTRITDGNGHEFVASADNAEVDVTDWNHKYLSVTPPANSTADLHLDLVMIATETSNGDTATKVQQITIEVTPVNDAALISGDTSGTVVEATSDSAGTAIVTGNLDAVDIDNDDDKWIAVSERTQSVEGYGTFTIDADGRWRYELDNTNTTVNRLKSEETLTDTFEVSTIDGTKQIVTVTIHGATDPNSVPSAEADIIVTNQKVVSIPDWVLLYNDTDADGNSLSITNVSDAVSGTVYHNSSNVSFVDYVGAGPSGVIQPYGGSFSYTATDGTASDSANVTVWGYDTPNYDENGPNFLIGYSSAEIFIDGDATSQIMGGGGNDILLGNRGNDELYGDAGDDVLVGGAESDALYGGSGADTFKWGSEALSGRSYEWQWDYSASNDIIVDYSYSDGDVIDLSSLISSIASGKTISDYIDITHNGRDIFVWVAKNGDGSVWQSAYTLAYVDEKTDAVIIKAAGQTFTFKDDDANTVIQGADPIILDLDNNGFALSSIDNGVTFDINADGKADQIAWTGQDGILAYDLNGNGKIDDGSEIFTPDFNGGQFTSGVAALASLDANGDGRIDGGDAAFSHLKVWVDANNNGISDVGELASLSDHGVTSISLSTDQTDGVEDSQMVFSEGEFIFADGSTGSFIEVGFDTIFGSDATDAQTTIGTVGNDVLHGGMDAVTLTGGEGADTFVFDEEALSDVDIADVITDYSLSEGDALDVSALLDSLLGEQASEEDMASHLQVTNDGTDTTVSVNLGDDGWKDVAVLQNHTEAVKILFDDKHSWIVSQDS
jgi:VCBS repeat-containing protein